MLSFKLFCEQLINGACMPSNKEVTKQELKELEKVLDNLFSSLNIDIEFTKHFFDRLNDDRNKQQITVCELQKVYTSLYQKHGIEIRDADDQLEELIKSITTNINIPVHFNWNPKTKQLEMVAKTIMRKKEFKTSTKVLRV